jgi:hypothetical protein
MVLELTLNKLIPGFFFQSDYQVGLLLFSARVFDSVLQGTWDGPLYTEMKSSRSNSKHIRDFR